MQKDPKIYRQLADSLRTLGYGLDVFNDRTSTLARLFNLTQPVRTVDFEADNLTKLESFVGGPILASHGGALESHVRVVPYSDALFIVDAPRLYRHQHDRYTYVGGDGMYLREFVLRDQASLKGSGESCLDLCAGSGLIGVTMADRFDRIVCADIHPPAVDWARINCEINDRKNVQVIQSDLYKSVSGRFSVITANPSYSLFPESYVADENLLEYEAGGGQWGLELTLDIMREMDRYMEPEGKVYICTVAPIVRGRDVLAEAIEKEFASSNFGFDIHYVFNQHKKLDRFRDFYRGLGIERLYFVIVTAKRDASFSLEIIKPSRGNELREWARHRLGENPVYRVLRRMIKGH